MNRYQTTKYSKAHLINKVMPDHAGISISQQKTSPRKRNQQIHLFSSNSQTPTVSVLVTASKHVATYWPRDPQQQTRRSEHEPEPDRYTTRHVLNKQKKKDRGELPSTAKWVLPLTVQTLLFPNPTPLVGLFFFSLLLSKTSPPWIEWSFLCSVDVDLKLVH